MGTDLSNFSTGQDDLARDKDQQDNLGLDHAVDKTRKQLGLVGAEVVMARCETLETNRELDVATAHDILNLEIGELGIETKLLDDTSVLARGKLAVIFRLCTGDDHFTRSEDECSCLGLTNTHDYSGETLIQVSRVHHEPVWLDPSLKCC